MIKRTRKAQHGTSEITTLRVGKNGVTDVFILEAKEQIERGRGVKIKLPRDLTPEEKDNMAENLALQTNSILEERRGNVVTLKKK